MPDTQTKPRWIHGEWTHLLPEDGRIVERLCDIVFDTDEMRVTAMNVRRNSRWEASTEIERHDVTDSIVNANPDAVDDPESFDLASSHDKPSLEAIGWPNAA